jgi:hypothetical protein
VASLSFSQVKQTPFTVQPFTSGVTVGQLYYYVYSRRYSPSIHGGTPRREPKTHYSYDVEFPSTGTVPGPHDRAASSSACARPPASRMLLGARLLTTKIERRGRKREVTRVRVDKLHPVAHALGRRGALSGGAPVAAQVAAAPYARSHRPAGGQPPGRQHQHRAAAASHIQHVLITPQAQLIQQRRPDRRLPGPVEYS